MFAVCGFGQEFPLLAYIYERERKEVEDLIMKYGKLQSQIEVDLADINNELGEEIAKDIVKHSENYDDYQADLRKKKHNRSRTISDDGGSRLTEERRSDDDSGYHMSSSKHSQRRY